jgi:EAL domain-containing protein (putative c-di-GMP-specific phosphodiesterase class I)
VDRFFVNGLGADDSGAIVETMISLSRALGLRVVAEGIETCEQLDYLKYLDCDLGQGFFFSRPLRAADAAGILASATHAKA